MQSQYIQYDSVILFTKRPKESCMAILTKLNSNMSFYLRDFHRFGRLAHSVDTLLNYPEVTRIHAVIEWVKPHWYIRDLSKNGIWLNGKRLDKQTNSVLALNDRISFSEINNLDYQLTSIDPPRDLLLPVNGTNTHCMLLEPYHFLPDSQHPKAVIYYDPERLSWCYENTETHQLTLLKDGQKITIAEQQWQFFQAEMASQENTLNLSPTSINNLKFMFSLSLDEEQTELKIRQHNKLVDLDVRSHHYLTLLLARNKLTDIKNKFEPDVQGWVQVKKLARDLGINESHVNIQIHRARKQFMDSFNNILSADILIERKRGKVRFAGTYFTIVKGANCESTEPKN